MSKEEIIANYLRGILDNEVNDKDYGIAFIKVIQYLSRKEKLTRDLRLVK